MDHFQVQCASQVATLVWQYTDSKVERVSRGIYRDEQQRHSRSQDMQQGYQAKPGKPFYIQLDQAVGHFYTAGKIVSGKVILDSTDDEDVSNISIKFIGRTRSEIFEFFESTNRGSGIQIGNATHFQQIRTLFHAKHKLRATKYEWEFSFEFPASTQPESNLPAAERHQWRPSSYFRSSSQSHPLPPTSEHLGMHYSGRDEYFLQALLQRNQGGISGGDSMFHARTLEDVEPLHYVLPHLLNSIPQEDVYVEDSTLHEIKSYLLDPSYHNRKLSLKEKSKSMLGSSSVPKFFFSPTFAVPKQICLGEDVTVTVGLRLDPERSTAPAVPPVDLQYVHISLMGESRVRSELSKFTSRHPEGLGTKAMEERSLKDLSTFVESSDYQKLIKFAFGRVTPSFSTYNYSLQYHLLVGCLFKVADQTIKVEKKLPIRIVSDLQTRSPLEYYTHREDMAGSLETRPDAIDLPTYEEVLTSASGTLTPAASEETASTRGKET